MTSKTAVKKHKEVPFNYVITLLNKSPAINVDLGVFRAFYIDVTLEGARLTRRQANNTCYKAKYMLAQTICLIRLMSKVLPIIYDKAVTKYKNRTSAFEHWTNPSNEMLPFESFQFTVTLEAYQRYTENYPFYIYMTKKKKILSILCTIQ